MARLSGKAPLRRRRLGIRPADLSASMDLLYSVSSARDCNFAALMQVATVGILRGGELTSGLKKGVFDAGRHPTRADVFFSYRDGVAISCTILAVNSKAKGIEARRKLPVYLPMQGKFLSPGLALWYLVSIIDPVPAALRASTPLFRDPSSGSIISVPAMKSEVRRLMAAIGRDPSLYGAHSCRIGGATTMAFLQAGRDIIKDCGRWKSAAHTFATFGSAVASMTPFLRVSVTPK